MEDWLAQMKAGKGEPVSCSGAAAGAGLMSDLATAFVEAKATVQMQYSPGVEPEAVEKHWRKAGAPEW